jgi:hypothetical protein
MKDKDMKDKKEEEDTKTEMSDMEKEEDEKFAKRFSRLFSENMKDKDDRMAKYEERLTNMEGAMGKVLKLLEGGNK